MSIDRLHKIDAGSDSSELCKCVKMGKGKGRICQVCGLFNYARFNEILLTATAYTGDGFTFFCIESEKATTMITKIPRAEYKLKSINHDGFGATWTAKQKP